MLLRVYKSAGIFTGPTFGELTEAKIRDIDGTWSPTSLHTGIVEVVVTGAWGDDGQVCVRQTDPVALTVLSMTVDFVLGGG